MKNNVIQDLENLLFSYALSFKQLVTPTTVPEEGKYIKPDRELLMMFVDVYIKLLEAYLRIKE